MDSELFNTTNFVAFVGIVAILACVALAILAVAVFVRRMQSGQGAFGSALQRNQDLAKEGMEVTRQRLQVERELLAAYKETNELMKRILARLEKEP